MEKKDNGNKDEGMVRKVDKDEEMMNKRMARKKLRKTNEYDCGKKMDKTRMEDGGKKDGSTNETTKKFDELKLDGKAKETIDKEIDNKNRRSKISVVPMKDVTDGGIDQGYQKRNSSMFFKLRNNEINKIQRESSAKFYRKSTSSSVVDKPIELLRSTHSSSSTSTFSNGKKEIYGFFSDDDLIDSFKIVRHGIAISRVERNGSVKLMGTLEFEFTPVFMCLANDKLGKANLIVLQENHQSYTLTIFKTSEKTVKIIYKDRVEEMIADSIQRIVASFDSFNCLLAINFSRSFILLVLLDGREPPRVWKENCKEQNALNLCWMKGNDDKFKLISMKRGFDKTATREMQYEVCQLDPHILKLSDRLELSKKMHTGHMIHIPAPLKGVVFLGQKYISYLNESHIVTNQITEKGQIEYRFFALLGTNKILYANNENEMFLSRLVVENRYTTNVSMIYTQKIEINRIVQNIFAMNEFVLMLELENGQKKYGYLTRERPDITYSLEIKNVMKPKDDDEVGSPPMEAGHDLPKVVQKMGRPDLGDILEKRWIVLRKIGSGSYGAVHSVQEICTKKIYVLKCQREDPDDKSIANELAFLQKIQTFEDATGFPILIDQFVLYGKWWLFITTNEGKSLIDLINAHPSKRFSEPNNIRIAYQSTKLLAKMHQCGYVHRDFHVGNILVKKGLNKNLVLSVIDFGFSMLEKDTKPSKLMWSSYGSLSVCKGNRSKKKDDIFSMQALVMFCGGRFEMFKVKEKEQMLKMKQDLDDNPSQMFSVEQKWMAKLYEFIKSIPDDAKNPAQMCIEYFESGILMDNVRVESEIEYSSPNVIDFTIN